MTVCIVAVAVDDEPLGGIHGVVAKALEDAGLDFNVAYFAAATVKEGYSPELCAAFEKLGFSREHAAGLSGGAVAPNA